MKQKRHRPTTWRRKLGLGLIIDYDGWRDGKSFFTPITKQEFLRRYQQCTVMINARRVRLNGDPTTPAAPEAG